MINQRFACWQQPIHPPTAFKRMLNHYDYLLPSHESISTGTELRICAGKTRSKHSWLIILIAKRSSRTVGSTRFLFGQIQKRGISLCCLYLLNKGGARNTVEIKVNFQAKSNSNQMTIGLAAVLNWFSSKTAYILQTTHSHEMSDELLCLCFDLIWSSLKKECSTLKRTR